MSILPEIYRISAKMATTSQYRLEFQLRFNTGSVHQSKQPEQSGIQNMPRALYLNVIN